MVLLAFGAVALVLTLPWPLVWVGLLLWGWGSTA